MLRIDTDAIAIGGGAMAEHDAADAVAGRRGEVMWVAAFVVDDCRHDALPECNSSVKAIIVCPLSRFARVDGTLASIRPQ